MVRSCCTQSNFILTYFPVSSVKGKTQSMKEWADELNMPYSKLQYRVCYSKMSIEQAFTKP